MAEASVLRVVALQPAVAGVEPLLDDTLRDATLPELLRTGTTRAVFIGRREVGDAGERLIASVGSATADPVAGPIEPLSDRVVRYLAADPPPGVGCFPLAVIVEPGRVDEPHILRVFRGEVRAGELETYVQEVHDGALADAISNPGLVGLFLGLDPPSAFVTVSAWTGWEPIEVATGGNIRQPMLTRNGERIVASTVTHYEIFASGMYPRRMDPATTDR